MASSPKRPTVNAAATGLPTPPLDAEDEDPSRSGEGMSSIRERLRRDSQEADSPHAPAASPAPDDTPGE